MSSYDNTCINKHLKHWFANYHSDSWNWLTAASMFQISAIWYEIYFSILITSVFKNSFNVLDAQTSHFSLEFDWLFLTWTAIFISFRITSPSVYTKKYAHKQERSILFIFCFIFILHWKSSWLIILMIIYLLSLTEIIGPLNRTSYLSTRRRFNFRKNTGHATMQVW